MMDGAREEDQRTREELLAELEELRGKLAALEADLQAPWDFDDVPEGARFRDLVENAGIAILIDDEEGGFRYCNHRFAELFGFEIDEIRKTSIRNLVHPDDVERVLSFHTRRLCGEAVPEQYTFRGVRKDGTELHLEVNVAPLREDGRIVGSRSYIWEASESAQANAALARRAERAILNHLIDSAPMAIVLCDHRERVVRVNTRGEDLLGCSQAEIRGQVIDEVLSMPEFHGEEHGTLTSAFAESMAIEVEIPNGDGEPVTVSITAAPIVVNNEGRGAILILENITDRRRAESELRHTQKIEALGRLAGGLAHDYNNLLQLILGECELTLIQAETDSLYYGAAERIKEAAQRAATVTRQLLAFSRRQVMQLRVIDLNELVRNLDNTIRRVLGDKSELTLHLAPNLATVRIDSIHTEQVIINLITNARDAMPGGGHVSISTTNVILDEAFVRTHPGSTAGTHAALRVTDTGRGMDYETQERVFEPFFTTKPKNTGTGLGLSMVYGIVKQSAGYITVESLPNEGTTVTIFFPTVREPSGGVPAVDDDAAAAERYETVLLVEDNDAVRESLQRALQHFGYTVLTAKAPSEALRISAAHGSEIDILVTDVVMPEMGGGELAELLTAARPDMPVLFISGYTDDAIAVHGILDPDQHFLQKPFTPGRLANKVAEILDAATKHESDTD